MAIGLRAKGSIDNHVRAFVLSDRFLVAKGNDGCFVEITLLLTPVSPNQANIALSCLQQAGVWGQCKNTFTHLDAKDVARLRKTKL